MSMYTLAKELFPPTGIERVVRCNFIRPDILNVIVSKATVLEVYNFTEPAQADQLPRLELVASYRFNGVITSMGVIRTSSSGQHGLDSILVSFKDAKVCSSPPRRYRLAHLRDWIPSIKCIVFFHITNLRLCTCSTAYFSYSVGKSSIRCPCWSGPSRPIALSQFQSITTSVMTTKYISDVQHDLDARQVTLQTIK
jgi:hypothetical protein